MNGEGITQPMRTNVVYLSRLRINQLWQLGSLSTFPNYLPCPMSINAKD
ncbi:unnamed protein product [marine sediment metagenome]|uniref:Uncharacterized protein n=1 Tax=marine sediment metagenome TaxID=412755 RepID=X1JHE9_9ZZZZ